ncbi:MAG: aldo/keto reductase [Planctomycetota bacterium]
MSLTTSLDRNFNRRDFLKTGVASVAAGAVSAGVVFAGSVKEKKIDAGDAIPIRMLGKTGVKLPMLGYGGAGLVKIWGNPLSIEDRVKLVRYAYDRGVRYFDTAGNYMESQSILGEALKDVRDKVSGRDSDPRHAGPGANDRRRSHEGSRRTGQTPRRRGRSLYRFLGPLLF